MRDRHKFSRRRISFSRHVLTFYFYAFSSVSSMLLLRRPQVHLAELESKHLKFSERRCLEWEGHAFEIQSSTTFHNLRKRKHALQQALAVVASADEQPIAALAELITPSSSAAS